jgi:hypothetical protein
MALRMTLACPAILLTGCLHLSKGQLAAKALPSTAARAVRLDRHSVAAQGPENLYLTGRQHQLFRRARRPSRPAIHTPTIAPFGMLTFAASVTAGLANSPQTARHDSAFGIGRG